MTRQNENIYLHFFDRELRDSVDSTLTDSEARKILLTTLFMSNYPLYASFSNMYECVAAFPSAVKIAFECESLGLIKMLTNMRTADEFLASRRYLYNFDKNRYPYYFTLDEPLWSKNTSIIHGKDTASILKIEIAKEIDDNANFSDNLKFSLQNYLFSGHQSLTFNAFKGIIESAYQQLKVSDYQYQKNTLDIRNIISRQYSTRYLNIFDGTIVTGIRGLNYYDHLAKNPFLTNITLYALILKPLFSIIKDYRELIGIRISNEFNLLDVIRWIILDLQQITKESVDEAVTILKTYCSKYTVNNYNEFMAYCIALQDYLIKYGNKVGGIVKMQTRILLVVATQLELQIALEKLETLGPVVPVVGNFSYLTMTINSLLVYVVKCQMGQGGSGGSILTLQESIRLLTPDFVIMCGVAWGADKSEQQIGDLIVSHKIWDYDLEKIMSDGTIQPRGTISSSSPRLVQMFEVAGANIKKFKLNFGLIASGSKLLNNKFEVNKLKKLQPELIGGDMESAGMASVCFREKIDCIMVKGICDWGYDKDNKKVEYQTIAMNNAIEAISSVLKQLVIF